MVGGFSAGGASRLTPAHEPRRFLLVASSQVAPQNCIGLGFSCDPAAAEKSPGWRAYNGKRGGILLRREGGVHAPPRDRAPGRLRDTSLPQLTMTVC